MSQAGLPDQGLPGLLKNKIRFDGAEITAVASSNHYHGNTALGKSGQTAITVGGFVMTGGNRKVEKYENNVWTVLGDFEFVNEFIQDYSMVNLGEDLFLFGTVEVFKFKC